MWTNVLKDEMHKNGLKLFSSFVTFMWVGGYNNKQTRVEYKYKQNNIFFKVLKSTIWKDQSKKATFECKDKKKNICEKKSRKVKI